MRFIPVFFVFRRGLFRINPIPRKPGGFRCSLARASLNSAIPSSSPCLLVKGRRRAGRRRRVRPWSKMRLAPGGINPCFPSIQEVAPPLQSRRRRRTRTVIRPLCFSCVSSLKRDISTSPRFVPLQRTSRSRRPRATGRRSDERAGYTQRQGDRRAGYTPPRNRRCCGHRGILATTMCGAPDLPWGCFPAIISSSSSSSYTFCNPAVTDILFTRTHR